MRNKRGGNQGSSSSHNSKTKPARVSIGDDEKENGKKNGATRKIKADRGGLSDILSCPCRLDHSNNMPMNNYKDEEDDNIEDYDHDQASDDDLDHGGRK